MIETEHIELAGSGRSVSDFSSFCEGDVEPTLNKRIRTLIDENRSYIVYLDDENILQFSMTESWRQPEEYGDIANRVAHLQTLSMVFLDTKVIDPFRRLLGESMARICDNDPIKAKECLKSAETFLIARRQEIARRWYFQGALLAFAMTLVVAGILWIYREHYSHWIGQNAFEVLMGGLLGGIGAFTAILRRFKTITMDASAGWDGSCIGLMDSQGQ